MRAVRWPILLVATGMLVLAAGPAWADPAIPTHYRSTVTGMEPTRADVELEVLGGDAYVFLRTRPGTQVEVSGYDGEPYLRFHADGTVQRNAASPARWLNDARYGASEVEVPEGIDAAAPPRWETVTDEGAYAWHDHRVHWMSPQLPRQIDPRAGEPQPVQTWSLELTVDDEPVVVSGRLDWLPPAPLTGPVTIAATVGLLAWLLATRRTFGATVATAGAAVAASAVGAAGAVRLPPGVQVDTASVLLPALALSLSVASATVLHRRRPAVAPLIGAAAGLPVLVWIALSWRALTAPIIPGAFPTSVARALIAGALGAAVAALVAGSQRRLGRWTDKDADLEASEPRSDRRGRAPRRRRGGAVSLPFALPFLLAHTGEGATWQALLVVASLGLAVVFLLTAAGRGRLESLDDLVLPLATIAIVSSLAPLASALLSDWVGWAFPIGVVALLALVIAAVSPLELTPSAPLSLGAVALAAVTAFSLHAPITRAWHPPPDFLPLAEDASIRIDEPNDGDQPPAGDPVLVSVSVEGASIAHTSMVADEPDDALSGAFLAVALDGRDVPIELQEDCTPTAPCTSVTFVLDVAPGERVLAVELRTAGGYPFAPMVTDRVSFTAR